MKTLKELISQDKILVAPGAYDAFTGKLIEESGFEAVYLSGAGVSYSALGQPDTGLVTQSQMVDRVRSLTDTLSVPLIADGDTGYGNAINVMSTVRQYEQAGASAIQLEDQQFPKRCGHLSGKELVDEKEMSEKIRAALNARKSKDFLIIARTDALSVFGLDEALRRSHLYLKQGADILFVESPTSERELAAIAKEFSNVPLMANMVEGGLTPIVAAEILEEMGYDLVIYPNSLTRRFAFAGLDLLKALGKTGSTSSSLDKMMPFPELNQLLGIEELKQLEKDYLPRPEEIPTS